MKQDIRDKCGVFGIVGDDSASVQTRLALYALQHRGEDSAGIATADGNRLYLHKDRGLVADVFTSDILDSLPGNMAIGHTRYATQGDTRAANAQPIVVRFRSGWIAAAHNGQCLDADKHRTKLERHGAVFSTTSDTEVILHLIAQSRMKEVHEMIISSLEKVGGAYSILFLTPEMLIAVRDPLGIRPLSLGRAGDTWAVASETSAFDITGISYIRSVDPGEMIILRPGQAPQILYPFKKPERQACCVFEFIYFARADSIVFGHEVNSVRRELGRRLAIESPVPNADVVISAPDSSNTAALGYAKELGLHFDHGLIRNHYVGRTFILPDQARRDISVRIKYNPVRGIIDGKKVVVVDDSIVRATTSRMLVRMIRDAGAKEIHLRIASPPVIAPCFYGVDTPHKNELVANGKSTQEIEELLGVDSIAYLSIEALDEIPGIKEIQFCKACFDNKYPAI